MHTPCAGVTGFRAVQEGVQNFDELQFVDGAAAQLKIDKDVVVDRRGFVERFECIPAWRTPSE